MGWIRVHAAPNGGGPARLGLATPGMRGAVERNRLRRRLRAAARPLLDRSAGCDVIVSASGEALRAPFTELGRQVAEALGVAVERARRPSAGAEARGVENGGRATGVRRGAPLRAGVPRP